MKDKLNKERKSQEILIEIGTKIKERRQKRELQQIDLAEALGVDQAYISKIENGKINLSIEYLTDIAEMLGVTLKYFFK
jgi:putative transcriptional regulator